MISRQPSLTGYKNPLITGLLSKMNEKNQIQQTSLIKKIKADRKIYHSHSAKTSRNSMIESKPFFNNKTREGQLIDMQFKPIPYVFIPGYKNDTFIMPNRIFQKGNAGKRFTIKMKDTSVFSFRDNEPERINKTLRRKEKERTIISRQNQQFNRIINENDGSRRAETNRCYLKTRKRFNLVHASQYFSECEPMLEPKDPETKQIKKISLSKTYDYRNKWRPVTRGAQAFSATVSNSMHSNQYYAQSVL